jgi:TM2 domain-containing membrane protein YozV
MMDLINDFLNNLPPLKQRKNSSLAAVIGFFFGGLGLGIYFMCAVDFLIPLFIVIMLSIVIPGIGFLGGAVIAGLWGYFRAENSNGKL